MGSYQEHALESASAVDLVVALYDGILRFLHAANEAVERGDQSGRRAAFIRNGDVFVRIVASGKLLQITRTPQKKESRRNPSTASARRSTHSASEH